LFCLIVWLEQRKQIGGAERLREGTQLFFQLGGFAALIGAVLVTQGALVGERRSGTAAWVLTKPTTRTAFVLAKFVGITLSFLALSLVIPALVWHAQMWLQWRALPNSVHFLEAAGLVALHQVFYIALTIMLGALFQHRGAVSGAALGFWVAGNILPNMVPPLIVQATYICALAVLGEATLSFLGVGVPPEIPSWGNIIAESRLLVQRAIWTIIFPGLFLGLMVLAINILGDGLRDLFDPRIARKS